MNTIYRTLRKLGCTAYQAYAAAKWIRLMPNLSIDDVIWTGEAARKWTVDQVKCHLNRVKKGVYCV